MSVNALQLWDGLRAAGTAAHNTVAFDNRDQMPRVGKFLHGAWLTARDVEFCNETPDGQTAAAGYTDAWGARHDRRMTLRPGVLRVEDRLAGNAQEGVLRWHLSDKRVWELTPDGARSGGITLRLSGEGLPAPRMTEGWISRYYMHKTPVQVLELTCPVPARLTTELLF